MKKLICFQVVLAVLYFGLEKPSNADNSANSSSAPWIERNKIQEIHYELENGEKQKLKVSKITDTSIKFDNNTGWVANFAESGRNPYSPRHANVDTDIASEIPENFLDSGKGTTLKYQVQEEWNSDYGMLWEVNATIEKSGIVQFKNTNIEAIVLKLHGVSKEQNRFRDSDWHEEGISFTETQVIDKRSKILLERKRTWDSRTTHSPDKNQIQTLDKIKYRDGTVISWQNLADLAEKSAKEAKPKAKPSKKAAEEKLPKELKASKADKKVAEEKKKQESAGSAAEVQRLSAELEKMKKALEVQRLSAELEKMKKALAEAKRDASSSSSKKQSKKDQKPGQKKLAEAKRDASSSSSKKQSKKDQKPGQEKFLLGKMSKDEFLKKYYGANNFNQEKEATKLLDHYYLSKINEGDVVYWINNEAFFGIPLKKTPTPSRLVKAGWRQKSYHNPFVAFYEIKNNELKFYKSSHISSSGITKERGLIGKGLFFKKGNFVYSYGLNNGEAKKRPILASSTKEFRNKNKWYDDLFKNKKDLFWSITLPQKGSVRQHFDFAISDMLYIQQAEEKRREVEERQAKLKVAKLSAARGFGSYLDRDKTLAEEVLNYTTSGITGGVADNYWYALKGDKCTLQPAGRASWGRGLKTPFNVRKINQTAFRIEPEFVPGDPALWGSNASKMSSTEFHLKSEGKLYFKIINDFWTKEDEKIDFDRLLKAWRLIFKECPGKKTKF